MRGMKPAEEAIIDHVSVHAPDMAIECRVFLVLVEAGANDVGHAIFLAINHARLQRCRQLRPGYRRGRRTQRLDQRAVDRAGLDTQLEAAHILRRAHRPYRVREMAHAIVGQCQQTHAGLLQHQRAEFVAKRRVIDAPGMRMVIVQVGNGQ